MKGSNAFIFGRVAALSGLLVLAGCGAGSDDDHQEMPAGLVTKTAILTGAQETTAVTTNAVGYGSVVVDPMSLAISGSITFTGLTAGTAHIHAGAAGANGASFVDLTVDNATHSATIPANTILSPERYDDLLAGKLYFNVHNTDVGNPGVIRGQIGRVVMKASLDGAQAGVTTTAAGTATFVVDPVTKIITGSSTFTGVTATGAHIHRGSNGGTAVVLDHATTAGTASVPASSKLTDTDYNDLLAGKLYVNIHSSANGAGEIRGQIGPVAMVATLNGTQEVPAVTTTASGKAVFVVDPVTRALSGGVGYAGVTATSAHIHTGATGTPGDPVVTLVVDTNNTATVPPNTVLTPDQYAALLAGNLYVNVHSSANPTGEIRGQLGNP